MWCVAATRGLWCTRRLHTQLLWVDICLYPQVAHTHTRESLIVSPQDPSGYRRHAPSTSLTPSWLIAVERAGRLGRGGRLFESESGSNYMCVGCGADAGPGLGTQGPRTTGSDIPSPGRLRPAGLGPMTARSPMTQWTPKGRPIPGPRQTIPEAPDRRSDDRSSRPWTRNLSAHSRYAKRPRRSCAIRYGVWGPLALITSSRTIFSTAAEHPLYFSHSVANVFAH